MQPEYQYEVIPLADDSGFMVVFPDLPGCMADGATMEEAIANGRDAAKSWILTAAEFGDPIPMPAPATVSKRMQPEYDFSDADRGPVIGNEGKTRLVIYLDDDVLAEAMRRAESQGIGVSTAINDALRVAFQL